MTSIATLIISKMCVAVAKHRSRWLKMGAWGVGKYFTGRRICMIQMSGMVSCRALLVLGACAWLGVGVRVRCPVLGVSRHRLLQNKRPSTHSQHHHRTATTTRNHDAGLVLSSMGTLATVLVIVAVLQLAPGTWPSPSTIGPWHWPPLPLPDPGPRAPGPAP